MSEKLLRVVLLAVACLSLFATCAYGQQDGATWQGGNGNWSTASSWLCNGLDFTNGPAPCVPNGTQFVAGVLNGGTINVDVSPSVFDLIASSNANASLSLNGTTLTVANEIIGIFGSVTLTNGTITPGNTALSTVNLTMQNSRINGSVSVIGVDHSLTGTADISGSTIQRLVVGGTFLISNSTLGDNSVLANSGQSSISNTSFNGQLLDKSGSLVMDMGSKINSVLFGTPLDVDVASAPGSSATLTIQGGSQLSVSGANLVLGGPQTTTGTVVLNDTSSVTANNENIGQLGTGKFSQNGGTNTASGQVTLGGQANGQGTYELSGTAVLGAATEIVGNAGMGTFTQNGGTNTVATNLSSANLTLGKTAGSFGEYDLQSGTLQASTEVIGGEGVGAFNQTGGTNTIKSSLFGLFGANGTLTLGAISSPQTNGGTYNLNGGALSAATEVVGNGGVGTFNQDSGTSNTVSNNLSLGESATGIGTYTMNGGTLTVANGGNINLATLFMAVGNNGFGKFEQKGGAVSAPNLYLGVQPGSQGFYDQSGGTNTLAGTLELAKGDSTYTLSGTASLSSVAEYIGNGGSGVFQQNGGTNTLSFGLSLAGETLNFFTTAGGGIGEYNLNDGKLSSPLEEVGVVGTGTFNQNGGMNVVGKLLINGDFNGNVIKANPADVYNLAGSGVLSAGTIINNGTFNYSGGSLTGNFTNEANFNISGAGTRVVNGSLTISGGTVNVTSDKAQFFNTTLNSGVFKADPTAVEFQNLIVGAAGVVTGVAGDVFSITGNFQNLSTQNTLWDTSAAELDFTGGGAHEFDLAGHHGLGFSNNFAWGSLVLDPGNTLNLALGSGDALYAFMLQGLIISGNTITNIDGTPGLFLYYDAADNPSLNGNYNLTGGGELIAANGPAPTPEPASVLLMASGLGSLIARRRWRRNKSSSSPH